MGKLIAALIAMILSSSIVAEKKLYTEDEVNKIINSKVLEKLKMVSEKNVVRFSKSLLRKEEKLKSLEIKIKKEREELKIHSTELGDKIARFIEKQKKFIGCMNSVEKGKKKRIGHLVEIIAGMKPAMAASVLSVQDPDITVKILSELPAAKMSKIFNSMDKEISARLQKQYMNMKK